jgi:hypothetical protein
MVGRKMELITPKFFKIKKKMMGMMTVRMKIGTMFPLCISKVLYGATKKYRIVPPMGMNNG